MHFNELLYNSHCVAIEFHSGFETFIINYIFMHLPCPSLLSLTVANTILQSNLEKKGVT